MRVASAPAPVVSRSTESKSVVASKPTVEAGATAQAKHVPGHSTIDVGDFGPVVKKPADAKTRAKQGEQLHDVADGVRDGSLTEKETQALLEEQKAIANAQKEAMADGKLTLGEQLKLSQMQQRAQSNIDQARGNRERDVFAPFDRDARRQAAQIDQIANGRTNGNITNSEAGKLLGQQESIADARDNSGPLSNLVTDMKQDQAQKDIERHSKPGTQWDFKPLPKPFPFPRPEPKPLPWPELPRPMPKPLPLPLPRQELPTNLLPLKGVING